MSTCLVGIGANLGDRAQTICKATRRLADHLTIESIATSHTYETAPVGGPAGQADFLNAAARIDTSLKPLALLDLLQEIEQECGRQRRENWGGEHWAARTLDLDLLLYDEQVISSERLTVPHPRMTFRRFVLAPAAEVAAELIHARMGWSVRRLLDHLNVSAYYLAIGGGNGLLRQRLAEKVAVELGARQLHDPMRDLQSVTGRTATLGLESLRAQARVLAEASWPGNTQLAVSDFWLDGWSLAAEAAGPSQSVGAEPALSEAWQTLRGDVVTPRLTVLIDGDPENSGSEDSNPEAIHPELGGNQAIHDYAERPTLGPVLVVPADDWPRAVAETLAACEAMR